MFDPSTLGALGGPSAGPAPAGPAPSITIPGQGGGDGPDNTSAADALKAAAAALQQALSAEKDPEDKALISSILSSVHKIEAGHQKEKDAAIGVSPALKHARRQSGTGY